jgi:potassium channel LctB
MGYTNVRLYKGGMAEWTESGGLIERSSAVAAGRTPLPTMAQPAGSAAAEPPRSKPGAMVRPAAPGLGRSLTMNVMALLGGCTVGKLLLCWLWMILGFGVVYWLSTILFGQGLLAGGQPVMANFDGFVASVYFSFVTALSIGYGDVVPIGYARLLAVSEGAAGLILFGAVISRLVSGRQEELTEQIHRVAFEERLERVRTNLHLVLSDLQTIARMCSEPTLNPEQIHARVDSAATVFLGELQTIHNLLYRPQETPSEEVLQSILASLAAAFRELNNLLGCLPAGRPRSPALRATLRTMSNLAEEICGECVPRQYAPDLKEWMDRVQALARGVA